MLTLAIDTSTSVGGVAIIDDEKLISEYVLNVKRTHSERFMSMVQKVVSDSDLNIKDIDAIACGIGPGSFTGVRIGVSAAKCLSYTLNKPIVGVCGLDALAFSIPFEGTIVSMIDAKHMRTFTSSYVCQGYNIQPKQVIDYSLEPISETIEKITQLKGPYLFVGDGAIAYSQKLHEYLKENSCFLPAGLSIMSPSKIGVLGNIIMSSGHFDDPASLLPFYMRESEPEMKLCNQEKA